MRARLPLRADSAAVHTIERWLEHPMFACAGREVCAALAAEFPPRHYRPGDTIIDEGSAATAQYVILSGVVRVFHRTEDGRALLVKLLRAPGTMGEMEIVQGLPFLESAAALDAVEIATIGRRRYLELLAAHPEITIEQLRHLSGAFCVAARNERQHFASLDERVAMLLLSFGDLFGATSPDGLRIAYPLTQPTMAQALGATERGIANSLGRLRRAEWISREQDGQLVMRDRRALEALAAPVRHALVYYAGMPMSELFAEEVRHHARVLVTGGPPLALHRSCSVDDYLLIGRAAECALLLPDETVCPRHCAVYRSKTGARYWLEDLGSVNGTAVNSKRLARRTVVRCGDTIQIGRCELRFQLAAANARGCDQK